MSNTGSNIFQGSDFAQSEDIVLIVENSVLFQETDFSPNRITKLQEFFQKFIEERIKIDYRDRFYLIIFNSAVYTPMEDFDNFSQTANAKLLSGFNATMPFGEKSLEEWGGNLTKSLQLGIQKCIATFKKIRNKTLRILLINNEFPSPTSEYNTKLQQIIERTAQRLDIVIDCLFLLGNKPLRVFDYENPLKKICEITGGSYFPVKNNYEFDEAFNKLVKKKEVLKKSYTGDRIYAQEKQFLEIIASDLEKVSELLTDAELKCNICFRDVCSCGTEDKYEHLRRCPSCTKILHLCCAGRWAEQQNSKSNFIGFPNVLRCPYCFYLLKVPREYVAFDLILNQLQEKWLKQKEQEDLLKREEERKDKDIKEMIGEFEEKKSDEQKVLDWLTPRLPNKSRMDIKRLCDEILMIKDEEERESFINYLKYKEGIDDDTKPL